MPDLTMKVTYRVAICVGIFITAVGILVTLRAWSEKWESSLFDAELAWPNAVAEARRGWGPEPPKPTLKRDVFDFYTDDALKGCGVMLAGTSFLIWSVKRLQSPL